LDRGCEGEERGEEEGAEVVAAHGGRENEQ
jgi:hypothetical protein